MSNSTGGYQYTIKLNRQSKTTTCSTEVTVNKKNDNILRACLNFIQ